MNRPSIDTLLQACIAVLGITGIFLLALPVGHVLRPWGFWVLLASEPAWFIVSWRARQWGVFFNALAYTCVLVLGVINNPVV